MLMDSGMESVRSQKDHHPDTEARTKSILTAPDSDWEETGTRSLEPNGQRWTEKHSSTRVEQLTAQSMNDTGQQDSTVDPDNTLNSVDSSSAHFKTIYSKDTSGQPDHSTACKGSSVSDRMSMECGASNAGPPNQPLLEDTAGRLEHTERPQEISVLQHNASKVVCHQEENATGLKEISKQPGNSHQSKEIHDKSDNISESSVTSHHPQNTEEYDRINDQQDMARELEETTDQLHNTMEREEICDQPDNVLNATKIKNKAHNTVKSVTICDQTENTMKSEISDDSHTFSSQVDSTGDSTELCEGHSSTSNANVHEEPNNSMEFKETSEQQHNAREYTKISDLLHTATECEEISDEPPCMTEPKEMIEQTDKSTGSEENKVQPHSFTNCKIICDQALNSPAPKGVTDKPNDATEPKEIGDQPHTVNNSKEIDNQPHTDTDSKDICNQAHTVTDSKEMGDQLHTVTDSKDICNQAHTVTDSKEMGDQLHTVTNSKHIGNQAHASDESQEPGDKVHNTIESGDLNYPNSTTMSNNISNQLENIIDSKDITYKPENTADTTEISVQSIIGETTKKSDQPENTLPPEESCNQPANIIAPKRISEKSDKTETPFEIRPHSANTTEPQEMETQLDNSREAKEDSGQTVNVAETKGLSEDPEKRILSIEITDQAENIVDSEEHSEQSPNNIESKMMRTQSDNTSRSTNNSEEQDIVMESKEMSGEGSTTNGTGNSDRSPNTTEAAGSSSETITVMNSAESTDESNSTNDSISVRIDDPSYNADIIDLNIVLCTGVEPTESDHNTLTKDSQDVCHVDTPSRLVHSGFPKHTDLLESNNSEILRPQVPAPTEAGTIRCNSTELNEAKTTSDHAAGSHETYDQSDTTAEEAEAKNKPYERLDHQEPHIIHDHTPEDEPGIKYPTAVMDAQPLAAESTLHVELLCQPHQRDTEAQTALDSAIEGQLADLQEPNMKNSPQSNSLDRSIDETLPPALVGTEGMEGDRLGQDSETSYLYQLKNDHSLSSVETSATQGTVLEHSATGPTSSELWETPSQRLAPDKHFVEDDSSAHTLGTLPPNNSSPTYWDPATGPGIAGLDTVDCQTKGTQHPDATPDLSDLCTPSALDPQYHSPSAVGEESVVSENVNTIDFPSSFHLQNVDDSMWASDGPGDEVFQQYGQDNTVSPSLQVGHVSEATESKEPALGDQRENKLQKDISQTPKSQSHEHFRRPEPDLEMVPTKGDVSEQTESRPDSEHSTFTSATNNEELAYDVLLVERYGYDEEVPDGKPTLVNPLVSMEEHPLQSACHERSLAEGLQTPVSLRVQEPVTDYFLNMNLGDAFPLASGTDPAFPSEDLISKSWLTDPMVGGFNDVEENVGEGPLEAHGDMPVRVHPFGFKVDFMKFLSQVPTQLHGAGEDVQEPHVVCSPDPHKACDEAQAAELVDNLPLGEEGAVDTSSRWETDLSITDTSSPTIKSETPKPIHFYNPLMWPEHSRPARSFSEEVTTEPRDNHGRFCSPVTPQVLLNSLPVSPHTDGTHHRDGSLLGAETSPIPDLSSASENVFLSPQTGFATVTVIAGTAEPKTQSNWGPTWKVPDDSVLQALTRKISSPKLGRRAHKVYRTSGGTDAAETRHRHSTPLLVSHLNLAEEKVLGETAAREPDKLPSLTPKLFKIAPLSSHSKVLFKQVAVPEDAACPNAEEGLLPAVQSTCEAALPAQDMDSSTSDPVQLRARLDPLVSSNFVRRHSKLVNSSRLLYQEYSDVALNQAIERQKRAETFLEESEPSSPRLRRKLMSSPDSYLQRLSVSSSASLWQDIPMIRGTSTLLSMTRDEQRLQEAKFELIMSEASYLRSLNIAVDHFQHSPDLQTLLSNQERQWLFSRLQEVRDVSSDFLYDLEEKFEDNMYTFNVCDVVLSHAPAFRKVYVPYVTNQSYQDQTFQRLLSSNPRFQQVLAKLEGDAVCQRLSLKSFLILPFQRITRLKLLVQNILKRTRPGSREEAQATQAYSLLEKLIKDCNENVQRMRSTEELIYLSQKIEFECKIFPLISQSRRLVKQGELVELESSTPLSFKWKVITRPIYLHLFNDCLLLSRRREAAKFLVFDHARVSKVHGEKCEVKMHGNNKNLFRLILQENNQGRRVEFLLRTETQSEKLRWISALAPQKKKPDFLQYQDNPQVQCLKSYKAREHDELSLEKADVIMVTQQSKDGWMEGTRLSDGEHGWFPVENVEDISNKHVRLRNLKEEQRVQHARAKLIPPPHRR
ncbi:serine-rich adhesin for platelets-like [Pleurodeles waltl]